MILRFTIRAAEAAAIGKATTEESFFLDDRARLRTTTFLSVILTLTFPKGCTLILGDKELFFVPLIEKSSYQAPVFFSSPHMQTMFPTLFRKVPGVTYTRRRIETLDNDFLDLDCSATGSSKAAIVLHGLEGDSGRAYILGMVRALNRAGWDAIAVNFRGCSGETNRHPHMYHSGETRDLALVLNTVMQEGHYSELALVGFSLGGNVILKYLGEQGNAIHSSIKRAVAFSVPCDLASCAARLEEFANRLYLFRFMKMLREKIRVKKRLLPERIDDSDLDKVKTFAQFDERYTAPLHGFKNAEDYWEKSSSRQFLPHIAIPTLLVTAADDPFVGPSCYPYDEARASSCFFLEVPQHGGHVGFVSFNSGGDYWSDRRAVAFLNGSDPLAL